MSQSHFYEFCVLPPKGKVTPGPSCLETRWLCWHLCHSKVHFAPHFAQSVGLLNA